MNENVMTTFDYSALSVSGDDVAFLEDCARGVEAGLKITVEGILEIGRALCAARDKLNGSDKAFGQWRKGRLPWLSSDSSKRFIQVFDKFGSKILPAHNALVEFSPTILYALASPSVPDSVVMDITTRIQSGEKLKVKEVQEVIKQAKSKVVNFPTPVKSQLDIPIPAPKTEVVDMMPTLLELGISKDWVSRYFYVYRDLDLLYKKHFAGQDRDSFLLAFSKSLPSDMDLTCVYQLSDFLVKLMALLPVKQGASHG